MKSPGFTKVKSDTAIEQDLNMPSPLAQALTERRKKMALKRSALELEPDSLGNLQPSQDENSDK